jgi:hypothetical protein
MTRPYRRPAVRTSGENPNLLSLVGWGRLRLHPTGAYVASGCGPRDARPRSAREGKKYQCQDIEIIQIKAQKAAE